MNEKKHTAILKQGMEIWNHWRKDNPAVAPDLSGCNLRSAMLRNYNLSAVNLSAADLRDSNLRHTNLNNANLTHTRLNRALFSNTLLQDACFKQAILYETVFADVNLSSARDLEICVHKGPSALDYRTLSRSKNLPLEFLRGCGLPDFIINNSKYTTDYYSCFISYSSRDQGFADKLYHDLQASGVRCWFAPKDLKIGDKFRKVIDEAIRENEKLLIVLSRHSINSAWVENEVETAFERENRDKKNLLFPIRLDNVVMDTSQAWAANIRRVRHIGDFSRWEEMENYQKEFGVLLNALKRK